MYLAGYHVSKCKAYNNDRFCAYGAQDATARYFGVHAVFNTVMVYYCFPDLMKMLMDPADCLNGEYSDVPTAWTVGLHLMHIVTSWKKVGLLAKCLVGSERFSRSRMGPSGIYKVSHGAHFLYRKTRS